VNHAVRHLAGLVRGSIGDVFPTYLVNTALDWGLAQVALLLASVVIAHRAAASPATGRTPRAAATAGTHGRTAASPNTPAGIPGVTAGTPSTTAATPGTMFGTPRRMTGRNVITRLAAVPAGSRLERTP
jgi:hypothetical protein